MKILIDDFMKNFKPFSLIFQKSDKNIKLLCYRMFLSEKYYEAFESFTCKGLNEIKIKLAYTLESYF